jgi:two-component system response regulator
MDVKNDLGGGKPTLLIAEDEESNYLLLKTILHKYCKVIIYQFTPPYKKIDKSHFY